MKGNEQSQNMKNDRKSRVLVPELADIEFGKLLYFDQMERIINVTHSPLRQISNTPNQQERLRG